MLRSQDELNIRLQEFPHWIFLFQFSATVLYAG